LFFIRGRRLQLSLWAARPLPLRWAVLVDINPFYLFGVLLYSVPFGIALVMPGWRSLFGLTVVLGSVLGWLYVSASNADGFGAVFALGLALYVAGGLISGAITRTIFILSARFKIKTISRVAIGLIGFVLLPSVMFASYKWRQWQMRPVSENCLMTKHPVTIGGAVYYLPSAPYFTIWTGMGSISLFEVNQHIRTLCEQSSHSSEPIHVILFSIDMTAGKFKKHPYCKTPNPSNQWLKNLCDSDFNWIDENYPRKANISSPSEFDHRRMLASYSYANFVDEFEKAKISRHPLESRQMGIFERYANGYWVVRDGAWKNEAGEPFTLHCHDSGSTGGLYCSTSYRLKSGPQVTYDFRASITDIENTAKKVDENVHRMAVDLATP